MACPGFLRGHQAARGKESALEARASSGFSVKRPDGEPRPLATLHVPEEEGALGLTACSDLSPGWGCPERGPAGGLEAGPGGTEPAAHWGCVTHTAEVQGPRPLGGTDWEQVCSLGRHEISRALCNKVAWCSGRLCLAGVITEASGWICSRGFKSCAIRAAASGERSSSLHLVTRPWEALLISLVVTSAS